MPSRFVFFVSCCVFSLMFSVTARANVAVHSILHKVAPGDTLSQILEHAGVNPQLALSVIEKLQPLYTPQQLAIGQNIQIHLKTPDTIKKGIENYPFAGLQIELNGRQTIQVTMADDEQIYVKEVERKLRTEHVTLEGEIQSSLYEAAHHAGIPNKVIANMVKLYSYDVDFQRDIRKGNGFSIMFEKLVDAQTGKFADYGNIIYAQMNLNDKSFQAYQYKTADGQFAYFDENGNSVEKSLLKTPVDGARITSSYGNRRHPILGYNKMHKGIDFGASRGTPVYAAGNGRIAFAGPNGSYGNYVQISHRENYSTAYAHLNGFAKNIRKNNMVKQGDVIGYVGTTGRSTGPHLHYEVLLHGQQINPLSIKSVPGEKLQGPRLASFQKYRQYVDAQISDTAVMVSMKANSDSNSATP